MKNFWKCFVIFSWLSFVRVGIKKKMLLRDKKNRYCKIVWKCNFFLNFSCKCLMMYFKTSHNIPQKFFPSLINLLHLTLDRVQLSIFQKNNSCKIKVLQIFGSWDQGIDEWFMNHAPLIPTLFVCCIDNCPIVLLYCILL